MPFPRKLSCINTAYAQFARNPSFSQETCKRFRTLSSTGLSTRCVHLPHRVRSEVEGAEGRLRGAQRWYGSALIVKPSRVSLPLVFDRAAVMPSAPSVQICGAYGPDSQC